MAALNCPCEQGHEILGEFWRVGGRHEWVFFDDLETSETRGGKAGAERLAPEQSWEIARKAAKARWDKKRREEGAS